MTHVMRGKQIHEAMERLFRDLLEEHNKPFPIKEIKIRQVELEILKEYGIENIIDNEDAESEYRVAVAEIMSEKIPLIVGGTSDSVQNNGWDYKRMFEKPQYNPFTSRFEDQWAADHLGMIFVDESRPTRNFIPVEDWYKFKGLPKVKLFIEETEYEKTFNSFMRTKAKEYVEQNA